MGCVIWLILRAFDQRSLLEKLETASAPDVAPKVAVIVPARDEEANISICLGALLAQDYPAARLKIIVVDDHSSDTTVATAESISRVHPRVVVIRSPALHRSGSESPMPAGLAPARRPARRSGFAVLMQTSRPSRL